MGHQEPRCQQSQGQARVFAMTHQEATAVPNVITGKVLLFDMEVYVLIDPGSTHSFISSATASCLHKKSEFLDNKLAVCTPVGEVVTVQVVYKGCTIKINRVEFLTDLIVFHLLELDIILDMDWLTRP